jgi:hypothetical protein
MSNGATTNVEPLNPDLTTRGKVRILLARGLKVREVALELGITTQAVYHHIAVMSKEAEEASA